MKKIFYILTLPLLLFACSKDKTLTEQVNLSNPGLIIINEGNYTYGNASITFFDLVNYHTVNNAFAKINNIMLGDVAQSAFVSDSYIYIIVNNSGKIIKADLSTLKQSSTLTNLVSPRYAALISPDQAIITDLYSPFLTVIDLNNMAITNKIYLGHSTEQIIVDNNYIYTISWYNDSMLFKIDAQNLEIIDSLSLTYQPNSLAIDKNQNLWVLSDGGLWNGADTMVNACLTQIDTRNLAILQQLVFKDNSLSPSHLVINTNKDTLYFLISSWIATDNPEFGVYRMSINDSLPSGPWIKQENHTFYSLSYIAEKNWIAISDAKDFTTNGQVLVYDSQANLLHTITVGIIPSFVLYKK